MTSSSKKIVAITGAAGYLGHRLIAQLAAQSWVERIIALDIKPIPSDDRVWSHRVDVSDTATLRAILAEQGVTNLVHAAFRIVKPAHWTDAQWRTANVNGSRSVINAVLETPPDESKGIHLTFVSSVAVYGYSNGQAVYLREDAPLRPTMMYGKHKAEVEAQLQPLRSLAATNLKGRLPNLRLAMPLNVATIRMAAIAGPTGRDYSHLRALTAQPFFVVANGGRALTQAIHEDDAAALVCAAVERDANGVFNGAPDDAASWGEVGRLSNRPVLSMPRPMLNFTTRFNGVLPALNGFTREIVDLFAESLVVDNSAARSELGWSPRYSTCDAFGQMFEALGTAR